MGQATKLTLRIEADSAEAENLDVLTGQLLAEVRAGMDVDVAELRSSAEAPTGAKSGGITELGTLAVQTLPAALPGLIGLLHSWMSRRRDLRIKVIMRVEDRSVELGVPAGTMTHHDLIGLIAVVNGEPRARWSRGGPDAAPAAEEVRLRPGRVADHPSPSVTLSKNCESLAERVRTR